METVEENLKFLLPAKQEQAKKAQRMYQAVSTPTNMDLSAMIRINLIKDNEITAEEYVLASQEPLYTNTMEARMLDILYLRPTNNHQGGHELLHLATNKTRNYRIIKPLPISASIIKQVHTIAMKKRMPKGLKIATKTGELIYDSAWSAGLEFNNNDTNLLEQDNDIDKTAFSTSDDTDSRSESTDSRSEYESSSSSSGSDPDNNNNSHESYENMDEFAIEMEDYDNYKYNENKNNRNKKLNQSQAADNAVFNRGADNEEDNEEHNQENNESEAEDNKNYNANIENND